MLKTGLLSRGKFEELGLNDIANGPEIMGLESN